MTFEIQSLRPADKKLSETNIFALEVLEGLSNDPKGLPARFFYDKRGSELFQEITDLEEYYPTACEFEIFKSHKQKIADLIGPKPFNLIELGSGDGRKTVVILEELLQQGHDFEYIPIDISSDATRTLLEKFEKQFGSQAFKARGLVAEYFEGLNWLVKNETERRNVVFFLGSNIGNFSHAGAARFLRHLWYSLNPGDLVMVGFDLKKEPRILHAAYNDSKGVTSEFNLNVLDRINRELEGNFVHSQFLHSGHYNVRSGAMESFIISTCRQSVSIGALGKVFDFAPWEGIHMEYSYKFIVDEIESLAADTGFEIVEHLFDSKKYYCDSIWEVKRELQ